ncbi:polar amino acid transport system substrate-binding protein [Desulfobaculum xiamenense]|uniref:Polar amino acid transport system substrate-binding protein n=1 Tax=Desulfobaculum xiamenense TaxID=995050 RepID=A0A846QTK5_9BACT|nr:basic amino acid ABC transporter substrate-binding protein [Desulfobaculum xiamenense]NJB68805.1 polar amino acid transport system substrate-binding protein [Desulfobaculum xiamenense]
MLKRFVMALCAVALMAGAAQARTIHFASDATWPPMEMLDAEKNVVGFCPEVVRAMAKAGGFEADIKSTAWDGIFAGLAAGKYDVIASSVSITEERKRAMDFSDPYFEVKQGVVVRAGSDIKSFADLSGKTVGAQIGTSGYFTAKKAEGATPKSYDEVGLAIEDLFNGRLDAVICDDAVAADFALTNPNYSGKLALAFLIVPEKPEYLGFAVKKGNREVIEILNASLKAVRESGEYDRIFKKWFPTN